MKNRLINTILALSVLVGVSGCNGFFESLPGPQLDLEDTFTDQYRTEGFLKNVYSHLPDDVTGEYKYSEVSDRYGGFWGVGSLEAQYSQGGGWDGNATQYANTWNRGAVSAMDSEIDFWWGHYYKGIAKAGVFIANVDKCVVLSERVRTLYKAEARALRAVFYWYILRQYGPCVLTGETAMAIDSPVSELLLPRSTVDDCVDYIVSELDFAAEVFKDNGRMILGGTDAQFGRLDRGQCKALKAKVLLYAASPLFNGNTLMSSMKNDDGTELIPSTVDPSKWNRAVTAYKEFFDEFVPQYYELHTVTTDGKMDYYESYRQATQSSYITAKEHIMVKLVDAGAWFQYCLRPMHSGTTGTNMRGAQGLSLNQEMVDMFFTDKGLRIDDDPDYRDYGINTVPGAEFYGSDEDYNDPIVPSRNYFKANTNKTLKQWENRDPRFYVCVTYNGSTYLNVSSTDGEVTTEFTRSGNSGIDAGSAWDAPLTGYGWRKTQWTGAEDGKNKHMGINLRLGDMYLGYAEALNETGDIPGAMTYLNAIRSRVGLPEYGTGTYEDANGKTLTRIEYPANKDAVRQRIQRERLVELALEGNHFFDVRRWMVADMAEGDGWIYPAYHDGGEGGWTHAMSREQNAPAFFRKIQFRERHFLPCMYFMPIPDSEVRRNPLMVQNFEWESTMVTEDGQ